MRKLFVLLRVAGQMLCQMRQGVNRRALLYEQQGEGKCQKQEQWRAISHPGLPYTTLLAATTLCVFIRVRCLRQSLSPA